MYISCIYIYAHESIDIDFVYIHKITKHIFCIVHKIKKNVFILILCGAQEKFAWVQAPYVSVEWVNGSTQVCVRESEIER